MVKARWLGCALLLGWLGLALAQSADDLLDAARRAVSQAEATYPESTFLIDQPLWREAVSYAQQAQQQEPDRPDALLLLAEIHSKVGWFIRAWDYFQVYLALGGQLEGEAMTRFAETGSELGYALYERGDLGGALGRYQAVAAALPEDLPQHRAARAWLARIHFERGETEAARGHWQRLSDLEPDNDSYRFYLDLLDEAQQVGAEASRAFREGLAAYEALELETARAAFLRAAAANPDFADAHAWAGRTSLDLGDPGAAERAWREVQRLEPGGERAAYFINLAQAQQRWGRDAATAFFEGQERYAAGDLEAAMARFDYAALVNPEYQEALAWAARSAQELGDPARAEAYWQALLALAPNDERARYFLELAQRQQQYGAEAGQAFAEGVAAFELADLATAEARFRSALAANPDFALAWGWLGRALFTQARYEEASDAYERAAQLEPDNEDYRFFAAEASALAGETP